MKKSKSILLVKPGKDYQNKFVRPLNGKRGAAKKQINSDSADNSKISNMVFRLVHFSDPLVL